MAKPRRIIYFVAVLLMIFPAIVRAQDVLIQVHLFRSEWTDVTSHPQRLEVLTSSSWPELASLKEKASGSEHQLAAAVLDALMEIYDLETIDDLFLHEKEWSGLRAASFDDSLKGQQVFYRVTLSPSRLPNQNIVLRVVITRGKNSMASAEALIDQTLFFNLNDPTIIVAPNKSEAFFAMVLVKPKESHEIKPEPKEDVKAELVDTPQILQEVQPSYPEVLRERRIGGTVGLLAKIDEKGNILFVGVERAAHPYLNYSAVQAFRQWTFKPASLKGKPIIARFRYSLNFYPSLYEPIVQAQNPWTDPSDFSDEVLHLVLTQAGEYCRKLANGALDFVCEETIKETHFSVFKNIKWITNGILAGGLGDDPSKPRIYIPYPNIQIIDPSQTKRSNIVCDYQIIRKNGVLKEKRIILKENGRQNADQTKILEESRVIGLSPLFAPLKVLLPNQQSKYFFRITTEEKIQGQNSYVVEARPKSGDEDGIWSARIWIDQKRFLILKCEIEGIPIDGYEDVLNECAVLNIRPEFTTTHEFRIEKAGILFPSRSIVRIAYPGFSPLTSIPKNDILLTYSNYKFFTVESEHHIID